MAAEPLRGMIMIFAHCKTHILTFAALCGMSSCAVAATPLTFVSGKGVNTGNCDNAAAPCRTFQYALARTLTGGEVKALDPANYGTMTIVRAVTITGVDGASIIRTTAGSAIVINAGPNDDVYISNVTIDGYNRAATFGLVLNTGRSLTVTNSVFKNFSAHGVDLLPTEQTRISFSHVQAIGNGNAGIHYGQIADVIHGGDRGTFDHVSVVRNDLWGFRAEYVPGTGIGLEISISNSIAEQNPVGFYCGQFTNIVFNNTQAIGNVGNGVEKASSCTLISAGNNFFSGAPTMFKPGQQ